MTQKLNDILNSLDVTVGGLPTITRLVRSSRKSFRSKSSNDVDRLLYLASLTYVANDQRTCELLLEFLDRNTGEFVGGRQDLAVSLSMARLMWIHLLRERGEKKLSQELLGRPDMGASFNLENLAPVDLDILASRSPDYANSRYVIGQSLIQDFLLDIDLRVIAEESDEDSRLGDKLRSCYEAFLTIVVVRERSGELKSEIDETDIALLEVDIDHYKRKIYEYLTA